VDWLSRFDQPGILSLGNEGDPAAFRKSSMAREPTILPFHKRASEAEKELAHFSASNP
jgi:hypothetical protein